MPKKDRERTSKREKKSEVKSEVKPELIIERIEQRWQPEDDLKLKLAVEQVKDLEQVHSAITFSCYFTLAEIEGRWRHLLTETDVAAAAASEISALSLNAFHRAVQESCLFSEEESEILMNEVGVIKDPSLDFFAQLLQKNAARFHSCRTPASLYEQWQLLYKYRLLSDQQIPHPSQSLQHQDVLILDLEASVINNESKHRSRHQCTEIQRLEKQIDALEPLLTAFKQEDTPYSDAPTRPPSAEPSTEPPSKIPAISTTPEKTDNEKYCAQIAGDFTSFKFPETSAEITIGRGNVDVDLTREIGSSRVHRRHCVIYKFSEAPNDEACFLLRNTGERPVIVNGRQLGLDGTSWLSHNSLIQVQAVNLMFRRINS